ncbi:MAG: hypothetical protein V3V97_13375, partial [Hyphomicrobiaceae bacterium]
MTARTLLIILASIALTVPSLGLAEEKPVRQYAWETVCRHTLPEEVEFTAQERWAWDNRLCLGKMAKMSEYGVADGRGCDAKEADTWPQTHRLSEKFLRTILFHEPFKSVPPRPRVHILCALFDEEIDIGNFDLENEVWLDQSRFKKKVNLGDLRAHRLVSFEGSVFDDKISLQAGKIDGSLNTKGATFEGRFDADDLEVKGNLFLR